MSLDDTSGSDDDAPLVLFGLVTDVLGHPMPSDANLSVGLMDSRGTRAGSKIENGSYSFAGLEPGEWTLYSRSPGYRDFDRRVVLDRSEPLHREDFVFERAWNITVQVRPPEGGDGFDQLGGSSFPILQLGAIATKESPGQRLEPSELERFVDYGVGRFFGRFDMPDSASELPDDAIGRLVVGDSPPIHVSLVARQFVIETKRIDSSVDSVIFTVAPERLAAILCELAVSVVDAASGRAVEGARAMLRTAQSSKMGTQSGSDGLIRFERLAPGRYSVTILASGYARETRLFDLEPGRRSEPETIALTVPSAIRGRIVDADGHPVQAQPSLRPYFEGDPVRSLAHTLGTTLRADADGRFAADSYPPGRYLLIFGSEYRHPPASNEPEWTLAPYLVDTTSGAREDLEIVLVRGAELTLKPTSKDLVGAKFLISTSGGLPYRQSQFYDASPRTLRIAPGDYELALSRESTEIRRIPIRVDTGGSSVDVSP
jgi:hypothetical protein